MTGKKRFSHCVIMGSHLSLLGMHNPSPESLNCSGSINIYQIIWEEAGTQTTGSQSFKVENPTLKDQEMHFSDLLGHPAFFVAIEGMSELV